MNRFIIPLAMSATLVSGLSGCCGGDCSLIDKPDFKPADGT